MYFKANAHKHETQFGDKESSCIWKEENFLSLMFPT